jgi:hypothetical protein
MSDPEIPTIKYLDHLGADNAGMEEEVLVYKGLGDTVSNNARYNGRRIDAFYEQEADTVEELVKARQLAFEYWVATADKVVSSGPGNRDLWADRYTNASVELFGAPDKEEAVRIVGHQLETFEAMKDDDEVDQKELGVVLAEYEAICRDAPELIYDEVDQTNEANFELAVRELRAIIHARYEPLLGLVDQIGKESFNQADLVELFTRSLETLAKIDDKAWEGWKVVSPDKGTSISIHGQDQEVRIPKNRSPVNVVEARKLIGHELLTHALRAKNGRKHSDERMLKGFPSYLDGEEGLAVLMGAAASDGQVPEAIHDRYIDIAFAMGTIGSLPKKRLELFDLVYARRLVRAQHNGDSITEAELRKSVSRYVDRIYRGSPGDDTGTRQAVYTADVYYYKYKNIANYIAEKLQDGQSIENLFDYLVQGKFDPLNELHRGRVGVLS